MDRPTEIILNGEESQVLAGWTILDLLKDLELLEKQVAVELNGQVIGRDKWAGQPVNPGDRIEIVHFVGGGEGWNV